MNKSNSDEFDPIKNFKFIPKRFMIWDKTRKSFHRNTKDGKKVYDLIQLANFLINEGSYGTPHTNFVVCQSTNLLDKDGKEIFEGSIIKIPDSWDEYGMAAGEKYEVYFKAGGFRLKPHSDYAVERGDRGYWLDDTTDFELLGHILSNPELLESRDV